MPKRDPQTLRVQKQTTETQTPDPLQQRTKIQRIRPKRGIWPPQNRIRDPAQRGTIQHGHPGQQRATTQTADVHEQ